jgi:lipopolysaccharide/colanic/teichoic acid biosynthesis glycosyltransferase
MPDTIGSTLGETSRVQTGDVARATSTVTLRPMTLVPPPARGASVAAPAVIVAPYARRTQIALAAKRGIDLLGSLAGLVALSPLLLLISAAIKLDSPGPVLFAQRRLGKDGVPFMFFKFRSMCDGNDPAEHKRYVRELIAGGDEDLKGDSGCFKIENDARVTRVGLILRRWSLDELPQLMNVLRGEMSLVGPRPPLDYEVELYSARDRRRLEVLPGMTGLWQVSGRTRTTFEQMVDLDLAYIDGWSFGLDLRILLHTGSAVLSREGAW